MIKSLVVDFDDTLSFTTNRDWENATPNIPLINKLNQLYDSGWNIEIVTARGQISCNGNWVKADQKYRKQIEIWLSRHGVKYTELSFQKKLGLYYIDDKGITPEDFLVKFQLKELKGGMSGASVFLDEYNKVIHKTAENTFSVVSWYEKACYLNYNVPKIHKVIGNTITMECIDGRHASTKEDYFRACNIARSFYLHPTIFNNQKGLKEQYTHRCTDRVQEDFSKSEIKKIISLLDVDLRRIHTSFSHGDFSVSNIIIENNTNRIFLIDPINDASLISSWENDVAKLQMSYMINQYDIPNDTIYRGLVIGHACRAIPYCRNNNEMYTKYITLVRQLLDY